MLTTKSNSYTFQKSGIWYFSRRIPTDLRRHYRTGRIAHIIFLANILQLFIFDRLFCNVRLIQKITIVFLCIFTLLVNQASAENDTNTDIRKIQLILTKMCLSPGTIDGRTGPKTLSALKRAYTLNENKFNGTIDNSTVTQLNTFRKTDCDLRLSKKVIHYDNFSGRLKSKYMKIQIPNCVGQCAGYNAISYRNENENKYISLTSKQGQLSARNSGDTVWNKDRVKLAITLPFQGKQINQKTIWYGFRAKFPKGVKSINAQNITFTEIHQIEKSKDRENFCTKGMFWRYNFENNLKTWAGVTTGSGKVLKKNLFGYPVITDEWNSFKIGVHFDDNQGWVTVRRNGKEIFHYQGNTYSILWSGNPKCNNREPLKYILQIGVYRGIKFKFTPDDYHTKTDTIQFDDLIVSETESDVDKVIIKSSR